MKSAGASRLRGACIFFHKTVYSFIPKTAFLKQRASLTQTFAITKTKLTQIKICMSFRKISICRELTKIHEEVIRTTITGAIEKYEAVSPKGEFVLVIEGKTKKDESPDTIQEALAQVNELISKGIRAAEACKQIAKITSFSKGELYSQYIKEQM